MMNCLYVITFIKISDVKHDGPYTKRFIHKVEYLIAFVLYVYNLFFIDSDVEVYGYVDEECMTTAYSANNNDKAVIRITLFQDYLYV